MYNIGEIIIYTTYGVCKIEDITSQTFNGETKSYYILKPINDQKSLLQLQSDNPIVLSKLRHLLSVDGIFELIHSMPLIETYWIDNDNERKKHFSNIIKSGSRAETIAVIKSINEHHANLKERGRKLHASDEQYLKDAEKLIYDEISYVLGIERKLVPTFINNELNIYEE